MSRIVLVVYIYSYVGTSLRENKNILKEGLFIYGWRDFWRILSFFIVFWFRDHMQHFSHKTYSKNIGEKNRAISNFQDEQVNDKYWEKNNGIAQNEV